MNVNSLSRFMRFFSVTNSLALMGLVSMPVPLKSQAVASVSWAVVGEWVAVRFWGWARWGLLNLVAQALLDRLMYVLSFFGLYCCGHVPVHTLVRIVLSL
jgi:hypothetical protein